MNNILNIVLAGVSVIGAFGGLVWLEKELRLMRTKSKSQNLNLALDFAIGAVTFAEKFVGTGQEQQLSAINALKERLGSNNMLNKFTDEQIEQIIQQAYAQSKSNGLISAVATPVEDKTTSEEETSAVVNGISDPTAEVTEMEVE